MNSLILKIVLRLIIYGLIFFIWSSLYFFYVYIHPSRLKTNLTPGDFGLEYADITLKTKDGIKLAAWFIPQKNSNKAIIICHGYPADKGNVLDIAKFLTPYYNLLLFDFRAMGESEGKFSTGGWKEREDFLSAVKFLKEKGFNNIGALGFSMGAAVILISESPNLKAIVSDSSYANLEAVLHLIFKNFRVFRYPIVKMMKLWAKIFFKTDIDWVSPLKYISQIKAPIFLIHSEYDSQIPLAHVQLLHKANPQSKLWIIPAADHGEGFTLRPEEYQQKVLGFFQNNL